MTGYPWCPVYRVSGLPWYYCMLPAVSPFWKSLSMTVSPALTLPLFLCFGNGTCGLGLHVLGRNKSTELQASIYSLFLVGHVQPLVHHFGCPNGFCA